MKYRFMDQQKLYHRVEKMARVLEVSRSGYYAWVKREKSLREREDKKLVEQIRDIQNNKAKFRYGSPRITAELQKRGFCVGHNRVARLLRENELGARRRKKFRITTLSSHKHAPAKNIVNRKFRPARINAVWASDLTYIATGEGWLYLCVIIDLYSRRVIGWSMSNSLSTEVLLRAFWMACMRRGNSEGVVFHSDRGVQYASKSFRRALRKKKMVQSMSRRGNCWDNACAESFFKTLKNELIGNTVYIDRTTAQKEIFEYIEMFYNRIRLHSTLGHCSPLEYERQEKKNAA